MTASGVGIIIGAGIYVVVGTATAEAGAGVWIAFLLAAALSFLTGLSYMELASMYPSAAGEYAYTRPAFPPLVAFLVGWIMVVGLVVAGAAVAMGFARYLSYFVDLDLRLAALLLLLGVTAIALTGIKQSARVTLALSFLQVAGLLIVIAVGLPHLGTYDLLEVNSFQGVLGAAALVFFAFIGFDEVITLSEETRNPTRTIPMALALALGLSTLLYVLVAIASVSVLGADALGNSDRPLADVIAHAIGGAGADVIAVFAILTTTNTSLLAVTAASRLVYGMASAGSLPPVLGAVSTRRQTPFVALLLVSFAAALFLLVKDLRLVVSVTDFAVYVVFLAVNGAVIVLRFKDPRSLRPFAVPISARGIPLLPILGILSVLLMMSQLEFVAIGLGLALLGVGIAMYVTWRIADHSSR